MRNIRWALAALGLVACAVEAHDGDFVTSFGHEGREQIGFAPDYGIVLGGVTFVSLAVQPDEKILLSATVTTAGSDDFGVMRLRPNGALDTNFGTQGQTIVAFDGGGDDDDVASDMRLQPNGRVVVCGMASGDPAFGGADFGVMRLTADGDPDTEFNADGRATVAFDLGDVGSRDDYAVRCSLQTDGKIVLAGQAETSPGSGRMAVARLNADGSRDTGFNGSGKATIDFGPSYPLSAAFSVKSLANGGTLVIGGVTGGGAATGWAFAQLDADGELDPDFGNGGTALFDSGIPGYAPYEAVDAAVLADGSFVAVGIMKLSPGLANYDFGVYKFTANGTLDTSFGHDGGQIVPFDLGGDFLDFAVSIIEDAQGRFVVVGVSNGTAVDATTAMVRLAPDGALDASFGIGGKLIVASKPPPDADEGDSGSAVVLAPDGHLLVASIAQSGDSPTGYYAGLVKLSGDTIFEGAFEAE